MAHKRYLSPDPRDIQQRIVVGHDANWRVNRSTSRVAGRWLAAKSFTAQFRALWRVMAKADRLERLDKHRADMETDYRDALIAALQVCASGKWGLFDHNPDRAARAAIAPVIENLTELAEAINDAREQLFMEPFTLHDEFMAARGPVSPQAVGEPKQARAWLIRMKPAA